VLAERLLAERLLAERLLAERLLVERLLVERLLAERLLAERLLVVQLLHERVLLERVLVEQLLVERVLVPEQLLALLLERAALRERLVVIEPLALELVPWEVRSGGLLLFSGLGLSCGRVNAQERLDLLEVTCVSVHSRLLGLELARQEDEVVHVDRSGEEQDALLVSEEARCCGARLLPDEDDLPARVHAHEAADYADVGVGEEVPVEYHTAARRGWFTELAQVLQPADPLEWGGGIRSLVGVRGLQQGEEVCQPVTRSDQDRPVGSPRAVLGHY